MAYDEKRVKQMQDHLAGKTQLAGDDLKSADYNADGKFNIKDVTAYQKQYANKDPVKEIATEKYDAQQEKPIKVMPYATKDGVPIMYSDKERAENPDVVYPDKQWQAQNASIVDEAMNKLNSQLGSVSQWDSKAMGVLNELENKEDFKYDLQGDVLYQQYKEQYIDNADRAMRDTVGQVSSMTGGYGNSYAQTAGQQTYNEVMGGLNDIVPELYQIAQERYDAELQNKKDMLGIYHDMGETAYNRERDKVEDKHWDKYFGLDVRKQDEVENQNAIDNQLNRDIYDLDVRKQDEVEEQNAIGNEIDKDYLDLEKTQTEHNIAMDKAELAEKIREFDEGMAWDKETFNKEFSYEEQQALKESGWAKADVGIKPSKAEQLAMDISDNELQNYLTKVEASQYISSGGGSGSYESEEEEDELVEYHLDKTTLNNLKKSGSWYDMWDYLSDRSNNWEELIDNGAKYGLTEGAIQYYNDQKEITDLNVLWDLLTNYRKEEYAGRSAKDIMAGAYSYEEWKNSGHMMSAYDTYAEYLTKNFSKFINL